ncbi:hypothetical protein [Polaromonas sp. CG9_12]|nr:hypothetical protein [Polaromonas sp. CG9_12]
MKSPFKSMNGLLATAGVAMAQGTDAAPAALKPGTSAPAAQNAMPHHGRHMMGQHDPARMQAWMAKRQAEMKARLKITPAQEGAWTTFTASMQPPACRRRLNIDPPCRSNIDPGRVAGVGTSNCG